MQNSALQTTPVREMEDLEMGVFNKGEKLVPGVSHAMDELVRHVSSYKLFKDIITRYMEQNNLKRVTILDIGCGAGWGSAFLSQIPGAQVTGIDICNNALEYAKTYHKHRNINFFYADITEFAKIMPAYDFIVSRNMVEHVENGIDLFKSLKWNKMLLVDAPYLEPEGANLYHLIHMIDESHFKDFENPQFLYQDMEGIMYDTPPKDIHINVMFILCQHKSTFSTKHFLFPIPAWEPKHDYNYYDQSQAKQWWNPFNLLRIHS